MRLLFVSTLLLLSACDKPEPTDTGDTESPVVDFDQDGHGSDVDCDDEDFRINPDAEEVCDGVDNDCDGFVDDDDPNVVDRSTWYPDSDGDGWGNDDNTDEIYQACTGASGFVDQAGDCDDDDAAVNPDAEEVCDGVDNDCNEIVDDSPDTELFYEDSDGDGWGNEDSTVNLCEIQSGWTDQPGDCDDDDDDIHPDAEEVCDGEDNDCDGDTDGADAAGQTTWYIDNDGDGYGHNGRTQEACDQPSGYAAEGGDCEDGMASVNPGEDEICDDLDNDCDGVTDNNPVDGDTWYRDADGDGYGNSASSLSACGEPSGYVANDLDCDDTKPTVNPAADERCDGSDNDCDGNIDEVDAVDVITWYADADGDGYGDTSFSVDACDQPTGYEALSNDCDDADPAINPAATELCDGVDNDCDGDDDDDRSVTLFDSSGAATDLTATFRGSSSSSVVSYSFATDGTLVFCSGTYYTHLGVSGSTVEIQGLYGSVNTTLSGASTGVIIDAGASTTDMTVSGLMLRRGSGDTGGAIQGQASGLSLAVDECEITLNDATDGAAIWVDGADLTITSSDFSDNEADEHGGAVAAYDSDVSITESTFEDNVASWAGGALYVSGGSLLLDDSLVQTNTADASASVSSAAGGGGGVYLYDGAALECSATSGTSVGFLANTSFGEGGGVYQCSGCSVSSVLCDWGSDGSSSDNSPTDIHVAGNGSNYDYGNNASFTCDDAGCS